VVIRNCFGINQIGSHFARDIMILKLQERMVDSGMSNERNNTDQMYVTVQTAPWFKVLTSEFAEAGKRALQQGVRRDYVYCSIKAGLNEVLQDSLQVDTFIKLHG
jgi:hypothetical protein